MSYKHLILDVSDAIATITFNRPKALNALNKDLLCEIDEVLNQVSQNESVSVVVFKGEGKAFIAGADISEMSNMTEKEAHDYSAFGAYIFRRIELMEKVMIASINGFCLGGGNELAMACDLRIASTCAKFGQPEVTLGITPGFSATQRLPKLVGVGVAKELFYTGNIINANEAVQIGLINKMVEPEKLEEYTLELAQKIVKNSKTAIMYTKKSINEGIDVPIDEGIDIETHYFSKCFNQDDQKNRMDAFLNKGKK